MTTTTSTNNNNDNNNSPFQGDALSRLLYDDTKILMPQIKEPRKANHSNQKQHKQHND